MKLRKRGQVKDIIRLIFTGRNGLNTVFLITSIKYVHLSGHGGAEAKNSVLKPT